jgi:hypothetical protein
MIRRSDARPAILLHYRRKQLDRPMQLDARYINRDARLPYGLTHDEIAHAVAETYRLFHGVNDYLIGAGFRTLEDLILGNSLSGIVSEFLVKNIARSSATLEANLKIGGYPDLLPKGHYASNLVLKGAAGIEIKASIQSGGWQGHNPEDCWLMVFRYTVGVQKDGTVMPLTFVEILGAALKKSDWSFSGRKGASRRTPTASVTSRGVEKLRKNFLYRIPGGGVGKHRAILANQ